MDTPMPALTNARNTGTKRHLEARHIQMISIGGTIGTGLFLNSSNVISASGALGALFAYIFAGLSVFCVCSSLGEMATIIPVSGSFAEYASRFIDPALGLAIGWNYCVLWFIVLPVELISCASFLSYWIDTSDYILMAGILISLVMINCIAVKGFGEIEYWLALIKILAIIFFCCVATFVLIRDRPGFSRYTEAGGPFLGVPAGKAFINTVESMIGACFSFGGTELIGITAGEARNPRKSVPKAINGTFWRILVFYVSSIFFIGLLIPANLPELKGDDKLARSPYVIALASAGIPGVNHLMNFVCFIAVYSAANSAIYASSRSLMSLAQQGQAPAFLRITSKRGVPFFAIAVTTFFASVAFLGTYFGQGIIFKWLIKLMGLSIIIIWMLICITHLRFRKAYVLQGYKIEDLPYLAFMFPYGCYFGILSCASIIILYPAFAAFAASPESGTIPAVEFLTNIVALPFFLMLFVGWKIKKKTRLVPLNEVDIATGNLNLMISAPLPVKQKDELPDL